MTLMRLIFALAADTRTAGSVADRGAKPTKLMDGMQFRPTAVGNGRERGLAKPSSAPVLPLDKSKALRDRLLGEIASLQSPDDATTWAKPALTAKNRLTTQDAKLLEDSFEKHFSGLCAFETAETLIHEGQQEIGTTEKVSDDQPKGIDKSVLTLNAPRRYRNRDHVQFIAQQPCLLCGRKPSDAHHLKFTQPRALGRKVSDEFTVPLCRVHHRAVHRAGNEVAWWKIAGIDPIKTARKYWRDTLQGETVEQPEKPIGVQSARPDIGVSEANSKGS